MGVLQSVYVVTLPSRTCYRAEFDRSMSDNTSVRTEIHQKNGLLASRLSRSLSRWNRHGSLGYILIPISDSKITMGLSLTFLK